MEKLLFGRIPVWLALLFAILGFLGSSFFGVLLVDHYEGDRKFGSLSTKSAQLAQLPKKVFSDVSGPDPMAVAEHHQARMDGLSGWVLEEGVEPPDGFVILSRYDGDVRSHVIELVDLSDFRTVHRWEPDADELFASVESKMEINRVPSWTTDKFRYIHPLIFEDGDLLVKDHSSPLFRLSPCGDMRWFNFEDKFHHSTEMDADGHIWVPTRIQPSRLPVGGRFRDDAVTKVTADGDILYQKSLTEVFLDNDLGYHLMAVEDYNFDPIHLNDIEPVNSDGPYWKKGDVFVSMRSKSIVALFRPSTEKFVWMKKGPWTAQHDVDILDESRIAVYSNNSMTWGQGVYVNGVNEIMVYDFETDEVTLPFQTHMEKLGVSTEFEGLSEHMSGQRLFIEEENAGRILIIEPDQTVAQYVNRGKDGVIYRLGWSRYLSREDGGAVARTLESTNCP